MSGLDLKFSKVRYFPGNILPSSPSVIVPTGFIVSCSVSFFFFFFFPLLGLTFVQLLFEQESCESYKKVSTQWCSQPESQLSWADCKFLRFKYGLKQCLVLILLHVGINTSQQAAQGLLPS